MNSKKIIKGNIFHYKSRSTLKNIEYEYIENGILFIENGKISKIDKFENVQFDRFEDYEFVDYTGKLIMPGFIDTHIHYPQVDVIASYGEQLLEWLNKYTFPHESTFSNREKAVETSKFFINELLKNGTTTAMVFCTTHLESCDSFFKEADKKNLRVIAGKVNMDRNAPSALLESEEDGIKNTELLIHKWHNRNRLSYAITPRFAPTSTDTQLKYLGKISKKYPDVYVQTHLSENVNEIAWVNELFPKNRGYLDVYITNNLVHNKSVFAHSIHLNDEEFQILKDNEAAISFCPSSNLFIGSGLFKYSKVKDMEIPLGIASDVGGGTSFSILRNLSDAYKICQLRGENFAPLEAFYIATLGGAKALSLDKYIGNFENGKEADFIVLNLNATGLMERRNSNTKDIADKLFMLMILGGEENIEATYILGDRLYVKERK